MRVGAAGGHQSTRREVGLSPVVSTDHATGRKRDESVVAVCPPEASTIASQHEAPKARLISAVKGRRVLTLRLIVMQLGQRFADALRLANELHSGQTRKASRVPYVSHVLAVTATVLEFGGDEDTAIAALLHDAVEDCGGLATLDMIRAQFGEAVADLVLGCSDATETPKPAWHDRKRRYLDHLPSAPPEVLLISAADKLHNLNSLLREERRHGSELWGFFRAGRDGTLWYFEQLLNIFRQTAVPEALVDQLEQAFRELDGRVRRRRDSQLAAPNAEQRESGTVSKKIG